MDLTALKAALNPKEAQLLEQSLSQPIKSIAEDLDIELSENEIAEALLNAKQKKRALLKYEENDRLRKERAKELMLPFNSNELLQYCDKFFIQRFDREFVIDADNRRLVLELSKYFSNDQDFNKGEFSLSKGLLIMGNVGTGKSWLMAYFQKNKKRCYTIESCNDIAEDYHVYKDEVEKIYSTPIEKPLHDPAVFYQKEIGYCFDDLGTEEVKNNFGNKKDVMADIIMAIYNKKDYSKFHVTTNLNDDDLEKRYGSRVYSRLNEMFNILSLTGKDRRK